MELRLLLLLILEFVHASSGGFLDWFRGTTTDQDGHKVENVHIEVLTPKGVRLWTHYNPDTVLFGVELYVKYYGGQTEALDCALCGNTSEPVDGKFMLGDDQLVARFGDVLEYFIITSDGTTTMRHRVRRVFVREELIKPSDRCDCRDGAPPALQQNGVPESEVRLLERMILRVLSNRSEACESISNWLVLRSEPRNERADLHDYVRLYLDRLRRRIRLTTTSYTGGRSLLAPSNMVVRVEDHPDGIAFQVKTTMDKLRILELLNLGGVLADYDGVL